MAGDALIDAGYAAKQVAPRPAGIDAPGVREICSVSECISPGAPDRIRHWRHNGLGWYNTIADALAVVPAGDRPTYRLFAYRLAPGAHRAGERVDVPVPADVRPDPIPADFRPLGFDAASRSSALAFGLECSPLSCNYFAGEMAVNEFCLFPSLEAARAGAARFSRGGAEPGDYFVVEVLEAPAGYRGETA